jgi:hypothetical protein
MKNYFKTYLILIASIFIFSSCSDEVDFTEEQNSVQQDIKLITNGNTNKSSGNSMLYFSNKEIFKETIKNLEIEHENYDDTFLAQWGHLGDDELDKKEDELGYTPNNLLLILKNNLKALNL